jgi:crotonobetainyl-CoA:carnitine CoA-transferase CaiB-like acyl-CoA transferase
VAIEHPELGRSFLYPRQPRHQPTTPWRWGPRAPLLGEHTAEVRRELGLKD